METLDKYWEDNAIYYVVFTAKCLSNNNEVIKKFQKFLDRKIPVRLLISHKEDLSMQYNHKI